MQRIASSRRIPQHFYGTKLHCPVPWAAFLPKAAAARQIASIARPRQIRPVSPAKNSASPQQSQANWPHKSNIQVHSKLILAAPVVHAKRGILTLAVRGGAAVIAVLAAYISVIVINRMRWRQFARVWRKIALPALTSTKAARASAAPRAGATAAEGSLSPVKVAIGMQRDLPILRRPNKSRFINSMLSAEPTAPLVLTGPEGSGKSGIVKQLLLGRPNAVYIDLRATPISSGSELQRAVVKACGYLMPPSELIDRIVFRRQTGSSRGDLAAGLSLIASVLQGMRTEGAHQGAPPVIIIDEVQHFSMRHLTSLHALLTGQGGGGGHEADSHRTDDELSPQTAGLPAGSLSTDPQVRELLDWCLYLSSSKLAHVVWIASPDVSDALDRCSPSFSARREKLYVDYPRKKSIRKFLSKELNDHLRQRVQAQLAGAWGTPYAPTLSTRLWRWVYGIPEPPAIMGPAPPPPMPQSITDAKGGKGAAAAAALSSVDSVGGLRPLTGDEVEALIEVLGGNMKDLAVVMAAIAEGGQWSELVQRLVADAVERVENVAERLLGGGYVLGAAASSGGGEHVGNAPGHAAGGTGAKTAVASGQGAWVSTYGLDGSMRYLRFMDMLAVLALSGRKYVPRQELVNTVFGDAAPEIDVYVDTGLLTCFNLTSSTKMFAAGGSGGGHTAEAAAMVAGGPEELVEGMIQQQQATASVAQSVKEHMAQEPAAGAGATGGGALRLDPEDIVRNVGVRGRFVSAATPRLRVAFEVLLRDEKVRTQIRRVQLRVELHRLRVAERNLEEQHKHLLQHHGVQAYLTRAGQAAFERAAAVSTRDHLEATAAGEALLKRMTAEAGNAALSVSGYESGGGESGSSSERLAERSTGFIESSVRSSLMASTQLKLVRQRIELVTTELATGLPQEAPEPTDDEAE